jgi:hypothetical protein
MTTVDQKRGDVLLRTAIALVLFKGFVLLLALGSEAFFPGLFSAQNYYGNFHWPPHEAPTTATRLATWDAQHYLFLATEGYGAGRRSITFFPLFPWLIRAADALPGVSPLAAALLLSNALSLAGCLLLYRFLDQRHPGAAADTLLLLLAFPGALFFQFPYTESLFLFLAVAVVVSAVRDRWLLAAAAAFPLALTRPNGVLIAAVLAYVAFERWRRDRTISAAPLIALAAPFLGFLAYLAFMRATTGNAFAGFDMQSAYNAGRSLGNFLQPLSIFRELADVRVVHGALHSLLDRSVFLLVVATLLPLWRFDRTLFWYALPMALVGPLSGGFMSYTRFAAILFPCHLLLSRALAGDRRRPFFWLTLALFFAVQVILLVRHVSFRWAG